MARIRANFRELPDATSILKAYQIEDGKRGRFHLCNPNRNVKVCQVTIAYSMCCADGAKCRLSVTHVVFSLSGAGLIRSEVLSLISIQGQPHTDFVCVSIQSKRI